MVGVPVISVLAGVFPSLDLLGIEPLGAAELGELGLVHGGALEDGVELVSRGPALGGVIFLGHDGALIAGFATPIVEGGGTDAFFSSEGRDRDAGAKLGDDGVFSFLWVMFHFGELAPPAALVGKPPDAAGGAN